MVCYISVPLLTKRIVLTWGLLKLKRFGFVSSLFGWDKQFSVRLPCVSSSDEGLNTIVRACVRFENVSFFDYVYWLCLWHVTAMITFGGPHRMSLTWTRTTPLSPFAAVMHCLWNLKSFLEPISLVFETIRFSVPVIPSILTADLYHMAKFIEKSHILRCTFLLISRYQRNGRTNYINSALDRWWMKNVWAPVPVHG